MDADLDTLLTALYCFVDDLLITRRRRGRPKQLTDAELVCLAVAQVLLCRPSEAAWLRYPANTCLACSLTCRNSRAGTSDCARPDR